MSEKFEAHDERTEGDNFHTSIYESDYNGLLIARCNQNGNYPHQVTAILNGLNGKTVSADLIAEQQTEITRLRADLATARADALEEAITAVENTDIKVPLAVGTACGASVAINAIISSIRALKPLEDGQ